MIPALIFFSVQLRAWNFLVDDAYISFRYAKNFSGGQGLVFNPGEAPVEGYTNFLWTLLLALGAKAGIPFTLAARLMGIASALGAACYACLTVPFLLRPKSPGADPAWAALAGALTLANAGMILWAGAGLEAPLFALLLMAAVYHSLRLFQSPRFAWATVSAGILVLLSLCRPEAAALAGLLALGFLRLPKDRGATWTMRLLPLLALTIVGAIYHGWRFYYYGNLLPNTYYAKVGHSVDQWIRGMEYLGDYFLNFGGWLWAMILLFAWRRLEGATSRLLLLGIPAVTLAGVAVVGGDALPMYRFIVPVVPLLAVLLTLGLAEAITLCHSSEPRKNPFRSVAVWALMAALLVSQATAAFWGRQAQYVNADRERMQDRIAIGQWLAEHYSEETIALNAAGAIPFYSGMKAIDMLGLNDRRIARSQPETMGEGVAGHEKYDVEYVLSRRPGLIFVGRNELTRDPGGAYIWLEGDRRLLRHPWLERDYQLASAQVGQEYFSFYLRKDLPKP
jgi:hypothetical protein